MTTPTRLAHAPLDLSPLELGTGLGRCVLLVRDRRDTCECLAVAIAGPSDYIAIVRDAYDVVLALQTARRRAAVLAAPCVDRTSETLTLLSFMRSRFPSAWRVGYVVDGRDDLEQGSASFGVEDLPARWAREVQLVVRLSHRRSCGQLHPVPNLRAPRR